MPRQMLDNTFLKYIWTNFYIKTSNHLLRMPPNRLPSTLPKLNFYIDSCLFETVNIREAVNLTWTKKNYTKYPDTLGKKKRYIKNIFCHIPNMNLLLRQMSVVTRPYVYPSNLGLGPKYKYIISGLNFADFRWGAKFSLTLQKPDF